MKDYFIDNRRKRTTMKKVVDNFVALYYIVDVMSETFNLLMLIIVLS